MSHLMDCGGKCDRIQTGSGRRTRWKMGLLALDY